MSRPYKILSVDGGGIKGLYSAIILAGFEEKVGPIAEHFDMICGTSTGGIIALALASGVPAREIAKFYETKGPLIFPHTTPFSRLLAKGRQFLISSKYPNDVLKNCLIEVFGDKRLRDTKDPIVLIPAVNLTSGENIVFKTPHQPHFTRDADHSLVEVALATSAAPTYFPIATMETFEGAQLLDGGVWANNPALLGIIEALTYYVGDNKDHERFKLLSIASVRSNIGWSVKERKDLSVRHCVFKLIETTLDTQSQAVNNYIKHLIKSLPGDYVRIESPNLSAEQLSRIDLDKADQVAINTIKGLAESEVHKWKSNETIKQFFN